VSSTGSVPARSAGPGRPALLLRTFSTDDAYGGIQDDDVVTPAGAPALTGSKDRDYAEQFPQLWQRAYSVAYRVLGSRPAAEDAAQETMAKAYSWWSRIATSPQGWVAKVAYGLAIDQLRRQRRDRTTLAGPGGPDGPDGSEPRDPRDGRDPHHEERMDLMAAIERLPRRQRQVVVLRYLADQSEADTAAAMGLRVTSVRRHTARALAALGGHLVPDLQEG
jgi:RNA polymerase sigma factor (sigma-70 family)